MRPKWEYKRRGLGLHLANKESISFAVFQKSSTLLSLQTKLTHTRLEMQFKNIVATFAAVAAVQAANTSNASNGSNGSNSSSTKVSTGAAATNAMGAGVFGAAVAAGVAFLF